jgi:hypothetical protein
MDVPAVVGDEPSEPTLFAWPPREWAALRHPCPPRHSHIHVQHRMPESPDRGRSSEARIACSLPGTWMCPPPQVASGPLSGIHALRAIRTSYAAQVPSRRLILFRHMDVPAAGGGERRAKITLFDRSLGASGPLSGIHAFRAIRTSMCSTGCPSRRLILPRHMDVPAAAGGELRVKTTLFARSPGASGRMPESPFEHAITGATTAR